MNIEERIKLGSKLHQEGYSCAQCVLMAWADRYGIDQETAAKIGAGLGAGVACGEICGAANAMAIIEGLKLQDTSKDSKKLAMPKVKKLMTEFSAPFDGKISCRDLKGKCGVSCDELISHAIRLSE